MIYPESIKINGSVFDKKILYHLKKVVDEDKSMNLWEKEIYDFILEWFSPTESVLVQTSGSTGDPKIIELKKVHMIESAKATIDFFGLEPDSSIWLCLPIKYIAAKMVVVRAIVGKMNLVYSKPSEDLIQPKSSPISITAMVQNQVNRLLNSEQGIDKLKNAGVLLIGGSSISKSLEDRINSIEGINAWHSYGMTETITHIALHRIGSNDKQGRFYPMAGIVIKSNNDNQLIIGAPSRGVEMLITNDLVNIFNDGSFDIIGRKDNIIITGGIKVIPEKVEGLISDLITSDYFIAGVEDDILGKKVSLFIEDDISDDLVSLLTNKLKNRLSKYELPKNIYKGNNFVRNKTGKVNRSKTIEICLKSS